MSTTKAVRALIQAGLMPDDARAVMEVAGERGRLRTPAEMERAARLDGEDVEEARVWWMFLDAVPREFKRLLEAEIKN